MNGSRSIDRYFGDIQEGNNFQIWFKYIIIPPLIHQLDQIAGCVCYFCESFKIMYHAFQDTLYLAKVYPNSLASLEFPRTSLCFTRLSFFRSREFRIADTASKERFWHLRLLGKGYCSDICLALFQIKLVQNKLYVKGGTLGVL